GRRLRGVPVPAAVPGVPAPAPLVPPAALPHGAAPPLPPAPQAAPPQGPRSPEAGSDQGERQLAMAQFYLRTGRPGAAAFYCDLIRRRYPGTLSADKAGQLLEELGRDAKVPTSGKVKARIGEITIRGNCTVPDTVILENLPFYPGQELKFQDLRAGEEKLGRLREFGNATFDIRPRITVLDSQGECKDILVMVHESQELRDRQGIFSF